MNINNKIKSLKKQPVYGFYILVFYLLMFQQVSSVWAATPAITQLNFSSLSGDNVQLQLDMNVLAVTPKIFQTDKPARIVLDFIGVKSDLEKKIFSVNQGAVNTVNVVEASGRTRVVINLTEMVPYETKVDGEKVYVVLKPASSISSVSFSDREKQVDRLISNLLPEQSITKIDFRRGLKGEGRLLIELSKPNTVVDMRQVGGKVVLNFLNTTLPKELMKSFDVIDFATPVQKVSATSRGAGVRITVTPVHGNYDYTSYQSDGLLTVDFIPLTSAEKEALKKQKFPFSGNKLSLNFQDIEVRSVLQILADFTDLNIIAADSVGGTVTLRLNEVPWDQALELILKSNGLAKRQAGNVILVAPSAEIIKIEEEELEAQKVVELLEPLKTEYIQINYATAEDFKDILLATGQVNRGATGGTAGGIAGGTTAGTAQADDKFRLISSRGTVIVDPRTNTLIVKDKAKQLQEVRNLIQLLDVPVRQVLIESRIVLANTDFARNLGVKFGVAKNTGIGNNKTFGLGSGATSGIPVGDTDPVTGVFNQTGGGTFAREVTGDAGEIGEHLVDLAAAGIAGNAVGTLGMTLARGADYVLNLELTALENTGGGETLANPRVMTQDRQEAIIQQGVQIPFETVSQEGTQTELIDAVLELRVTPQITPNGEVIMDLEISNDSPDLGTGGIATRSVITKIQVGDGETVVLGGIYQQQKAKTVFKIPWFGDLPGIGFLFTKKEVSDFKSELLIFVTPKIIKGNLAVR